MRYCGQCGAPLDSQALASGRCPSCGTAITPSGDIRQPAPLPDPRVASAERTTVPDVPPPAHLGLPSAAVRWPWEPEKGPMSTPHAGTKKMMVVAGVLFLTCAGLLMCADVLLVLGSH